MGALATLDARALDQHAPASSRCPVAVYLAGLTSSNSRRAMRGALARVVDLATGGADLEPEAFPWEQLRVEHVSAVRAGLVERFAPATGNQALAALRGVLKASWRLGLMDSDTYHRAADVDAIRGDRLPRGRALDAGELKALFAEVAADTSPLGVRDTAVLAIAFGCGLRRAEVVALDLADYQDRDAGELKIRHAKGGKQRLVYATNGAKRALDRWIELRGEEPGPVFLPVRKGGRIERRRMSPAAVRVVLRRWCDRAGVADATPHDLRRTYCGEALDAGADISAVQKLMGHSSPGTTARYDRRPERAKRKAAELVFVPLP